MIITLILIRASLVAQRLKRLPPMREAQVPSLGQEDPLEKEMIPIPVFLPGESHGRRSLVGYSPRGCTESDTTEQLAYCIAYMLGLLGGLVHMGQCLACVESLAGTSYSPRLWQGCWGVESAGKGSPSPIPASPPTSSSEPSAPAPPDHSPLLTPPEVFPHSRT